MSISVIGAGAFGTALAATFADNGPVTLWGRNLDTGDRTGLPDRVTPTCDLGRAARSDILIMAIPAQVLGAFVKEHHALLSRKTLVVCSKGIDLATLRGPSSLLAEIIPAAQIAILTGPSFADDIIRGLPTALTLACRDVASGETLQKMLSGKTLRLYLTDDVNGAELGGALKNVYAIAAGASMGAGLGESARAALVTRGFAEMLRLAPAFGARVETLHGLSGFGDLMLTATSEKSRNYRLGYRLGQGMAPEAGVTVEGAATAQAITALAEKNGLEAPIACAVADLLDRPYALREIVAELMSRPLKEE